ncbi:MAG: Secretion system C-terminal sorting domain [Bacteroidota bacterium]|jgi:hypothetical protein
MFIKQNTIIVMLLVAQFANTANAQSNAQILAEAEMKYWNMRARVVGYDADRENFSGMIYHGNAAGESLMPHTRLKSRDAGFWPYMFDLGGTNAGISGPCFSQFGRTVSITPVNNSNGQTQLDPRELSDPQLEGILRYGENPMITAGYYLAVLSTEWALLAKDGANTLATEQEILDMMLMFERLDASAEASYGVGSLTDGFMLRDDVPEDFALTHSDKKTDLIYSNFSCPVAADWDGNFNDPIYDPIALRQCDPMFAKVQGTSILTHKPSQLRVNVASGDELTGILFGLVFVKKFVGASVTVNGINLHQRAAQISDRILTYASLGQTNSNGTPRGSWILVDPNGDPVCKGPLMLTISAPAARIGKMISGISHSTNASQSIGSLITNLYVGYWRMHPNLSAPFTFTVLLPTVDINGLPFNLNLVVTLDPTTIGTFKNPVPPANHEFNFANYARLIAITGQARITSTPLIVPGGYGSDFSGRRTLADPSNFLGFQLYDLMGSIFNNYNPTNGASFWLNEFAKMKCYGCCYQVNGAGVYKDCENFEINTQQPISAPWNRQDRWNHTPDDLEIMIGNVNDVKANPGKGLENLSSQYAGIDYMLAYNLFRLKFTANGTTNRMERLFQGNYPQTSNNAQILGDATRPVVRKAVFTIESDNATIASNGSAIMRAGSSITLKPGFKVQPGGVLDAKIERYDCKAVPHYNRFQNRMADTIPDYLTEIADTVFVDNYTDTLSVPDDDSVEYYMNAFVVTQTSDSTSEVKLHPDWIWDSTVFGGIIYIGSSQKMGWPSNAKESVVYPNPASKFVNVRIFAKINADAKASMLNAMGLEQQVQVQIKQHSNYSEFQFDTEALPAGLYFARLVIDGIPRDFKFTKQ